MTAFCPQGPCHFIAPGGAVGAGSPLAQIEESLLTSFDNV
jgi:hypothetical protein